MIFRARAEKPAMIKWARESYKVDLQADESDAADACHVCAWAMNQLKMPAVNW